MQKKFWYLSLLTLLSLVGFSMFACTNQLMRNITIVYNIDNDDQVRSLSFTVPDGTYLQGNPDAWGDSSWGTSQSTGDYGYTDTKGSRHYFFPKGDDGVYTFYYGSSKKTWDTSQPVTTDLFIHPKYETSASNALAFVKYKKSSSAIDRTGRITYTTVDCEYPVELPSTTDNQYTLDVSAVITKIRSHNISPDLVQVLDPEVGYGYIDYNDNGRRYCLYPNELFLYDNEGNKYEGVCRVDGDIELHFEYQDGGYAPIADYFGTVSDTLDTLNSVNVQMVFIPGTKDENNVEHPWPNSRTYATEAYAGTSYGDANYSYFADDTPDYNHHIKDMLVMDAPLTQDVVSKIITDNAFQNIFRFYELDESEAFSSGLQFKGNAVGWNYVTVYDCMAMANYMTYMYNLNNTTSAGFKPLSYVYLNADRTPFFDCVAANDGADTPIIIEKDSNGYRLLTSNEWEYCAKIITDERQLPNLENELVSRLIPAQLHKKASDSSSGYLYNFKNSNEGKQNILQTNPHYSGSGAGLAVAKVLSNGLITYNSNSLRSGAVAFGRDANTSKRELDLGLIVRLDYRGYMDYNVRNGAGLYNMSGYMWNICSPLSDYSSNENFMITRGASFNTNATGESATAYRLGCVRSNNILTRSDSIGVRFCRYI